MYFRSLIKVAAFGFIMGMGGANSGFVANTNAGLPSAFISSKVSQQTAQYVSPYGAPVTVDCFIPRNAACPMPAVVILHGSDGGRRYADSYRKAAEALAASGYATFLINYFEGAPHAPLPDLYRNTIPSPQSFHAWKSTAQAGLDFVSSFPGVDKNRIGVIGFSLGGFIASSIATEDSRIDSLVILSGGIPPASFAKVHSGMPTTLIIHGNQDFDVPVQEAYRYDSLLKAAGVPHKTLILDCEGHLPYKAHRKFVAENVVEFLDENL